MQTKLAALGVGSAATMWFVADAMARGRQVPFMTLWTRCTFWWLLSPADYLSSRGKAGLRKLLLQGLLAALVYGAGALLAGVLGSE